MTLPSNAAAKDDLIGSWRLPASEGPELGCYFYPDGVFVMRNPHQRRFALQGVWQLEEGGRRLVISDMLDPRTTISDEERELIRAERHTIAIKEISRDSIVWKPESADEEVELTRIGGLPSLAEKAFWKKLLGL